MTPPPPLFFGSCGAHIVKSNLNNILDKSLLRNIYWNGLDLLHTYLLPYFYFQQMLVSRVFFFLENILYPHLCHFLTKFPEQL